jgi:hypothetical protein
VARSVSLYALAGEDEADLARRFERLRRLSPPGARFGLDLPEWRIGGLVGTVGHIGDQVGQWRALGVSSLILTLGAAPFTPATDDDMGLVAQACRV